MKVAPRLIGQARETAGLTQAQLAKRAGIPRSVLNVYERGRREPGVDQLASILAAAGFRLEITSLIDRKRAGRILADVLDLAEALPWRPKRTLSYPSFTSRIHEQAG